jgi:hypothetical protein
MKIRAFSMLWLFVLGSPALAVQDAQIDPPFKRASVPGKLIVKSIDEQDLSPSVKENARAQVRLMKEHKVMPVSDHRIPDFAGMESEHRAHKAQVAQLLAEKKINISPANVDATSLRGESVLGAIPSGVLMKESWTGLSRMFNHPHLGRVILEETDLAKAGGGAVFTKEMINADVNGEPAVLLSMQGSPKRSETSLMWFSNGVLYLLRTPKVDDRARDELLNIAQHLSK